MATLTGAALIRRTIIHQPGVLLWMAVVGTLSTLVVVLSMAVHKHPFAPQDVRVNDWIVDWNFPGLDVFLTGVEFITSDVAAGFMGVLAVVFLWLMGKTRLALAVAFFGGVLGLMATFGEHSLGDLVGRVGPEVGSSVPSFPSGHAFGSVVFFGFIGFLAVYYRLSKRFLAPLLMVIGALILLSGPAKIHVQGHWPSDAAAGYLLGIIWLLVIIPMFLRFRRVSWLSSPIGREEHAIVACESCKVASSIASVVVLDPDEGTATKVYAPPPLVRILYWMAFQAKFPYETNSAALESGRYRRQIASLLTIHRFGKDLVAPVTAIDCGHGNCRFVTEFIPGELAENDEPAQKFMGEVSQIFAEAGLSVWQVNPRNPHAHTNLIRSPEGDYTIIDLESAVISLFPAPGQFRSSLKSGNLPVFDDIDFPRLRTFISSNEAALMTSIGADGIAALKHATDHAEEAINTWKAAEPRIFGHLIAGIYRLLNFKARFQHLMGAISGADKAAQVFLCGGIDRWEREGRIEPAEAMELRRLLESSEAQDALHHLGVHLILSVALFFPVPGLRSLSRMAWTVVFWGKAQLNRLLHTGKDRGETRPNIHTPLVMFLALIPALGGIAYLAAKPLRKKMLIRLMLDQVAWKLPLRLYTRLHLGRWLAPAANKTQPPAATNA